MYQLYLLATPIGNLEDITLRALRILKVADLILCEDTRKTMILLNHYQIRKPLLSYHQHSTGEKINEVVEQLRQGKTLAYVTEAGTPGLADPGGRLISQLEEKLGSQVKIMPLPGPSALAAAVSVSGLPGDRFNFYGFLPHKKGRETMFREMTESDQTSIFYESPHRVIKTLEKLASLLSDERKVVVCREMTKIFEEITKGNIQQIKSFFEKNPEKVKGEFVVLVSGKK